MDRIEMEVARIAARERRTALIAGAAAAALALAVIAFALAAQQRASAGEQRVVTQRIAAAAPQSAPTANAAPGDAAAEPTAGSPASHGVAPSGSATGASESDGIDRLPMTSQSASQFMALYQRAAETFSVNWRLIASIHQQETAFSSAPGTYRGLNFARCCAGPMQFNVTNGRVSTWERFRDAFRRAERPTQYPHRTRRHPSVYDDFDAIMAAGALLRANGAGERLDGSAWLASYHYYGHDFTGLRYADQVLARAVGWAQDGLCVQCPVDAQLAARFDAAFAAPYRAELVAAERRARARERAKARARARREREHRKRVREARERARREAERKARARRQAAADRTAKAKAEADDAQPDAPPAHTAPPESESQAKPSPPPSTVPETSAATAPVAPASATAPPTAAATAPPAPPGGQPAG